MVNKKLIAKVWIKSVLSKLTTTPTRGWDKNETYKNIKQLIAIINDTPPISVHMGITANWREHYITCWNKLHTMTKEELLWELMDIPNE